MYAMMQCKAKSENFTHILGYQIWAVTTGPISTSVEQTDGKFDLFHQGSGFAEAGLWSVGIPPKSRWCHTICIKVFWEVERANIQLRSVAGFIGLTSYLVSLSTY